jgi:large subunit ribosomal protein L14e
MIEIGRLCVKIAGRDAKGKCVIVDIIDNNYVLIDGQVRRRKCNVSHIEPLNQVLPIRKNATHEDVVSEFNKLGLEIAQKKSKQPSEKPKKQRKTKEKVAEEPAPKKRKAAKKQ